MSGPGLSFVNQVVSDVFNEYFEDAVHIDSSGMSNSIRIIRFESIARASPGGQAFEDQGPYILVQATAANIPERGSQITINGEDPKTVIARDMHSLRGYVRLTLSDL